MRTCKGSLVSRQHLSQSHGILHALLRLLGISDRSNFLQCPTGHTFSFENDRGIETVSSASEFLGDTLNIWDNNRAMVHCI
jgi:hypothetical protein